MCKFNRLKYHNIIATPIAMAAEARQNGFSVEVCDRFISYCQVLNEQVTQSTIVYMEQLCIPYLERTLEHLYKADEKCNNNN